MEVEYAAYAGVPSRNALRRNGGFEVWQRDAGEAAYIPIASGVQYTADGWYLYCPASQPGSVWQTVPWANGSRWGARVQRDAGATGVSPMYFGFPLDTDEIYPLLGQFLRLSFTARSAGPDWSPAGGFLYCSVFYGTGAPTKLVGGAGYTGQTTFFTVSAPLTTTAARFQGGSAVVLPITARQAEVCFYWTPVGTAGSVDAFYVDDVQLEVVANPQQQASPFERLMFEEELRLCQRHFFKTFKYTIAPASAVGQDTGECRSNITFAGADNRAGNAHAMRFPVSMRIPPTLYDYNVEAAGGLPRNLSLGLNHTAPFPSASENSFTCGSTGVATGATQHHLGIHFTADAGI